jgi:hypothetical protein
MLHILPGGLFLRQLFRPGLTCRQRDPQQSCLEEDIAENMAPSPDCHVGYRNHVSRFREKLCGLHGCESDFGNY